MEKRKEFLVCIDSDGCVMDTMDLKHDKCLAPCMLMVWDLGKPFPGAGKNAEGSQ